MVKKPIEYYTIAANHWVFETQREVVLEVETFDSFEEARSHIYDKNDGKSLISRPNKMELNLKFQTNQNVYYFDII